MITNKIMHINNQYYLDNDYTVLFVHFLIYNIRIYTVQSQFSLTLYFSPYIKYVHVYHIQHTFKTSLQLLTAVNIASMYDYWSLHAPQDHEPISTTRLIIVKLTTYV